jgi:hypothetical protein
MLYYVVGWIWKDLDHNIDGVVGVFDNPELAKQHAAPEWERLKDDNEELLEDVGYGEDDIAREKETGVFEVEGPARETIAVYIQEVNGKAELKGFFKAKGWMTDWKKVEINKVIG